MANTLLFCDPFNTYVDTGSKFLLRYWTSSNGSYAVPGNGTFVGGFISKTFDQGEQSEVATGFTYTWGGGAGSIAWMGNSNPANGNYNGNFDSPGLNILADGRLAIVDNVSSPGFVVAVSTVALHIGVPVFIEWLMSVGFTGTGTTGTRDQLSVVQLNGTTTGVGLGTTGSPIAWTINVTGTADWDYSQFTVGGTLGGIYVSTGELFGPVQFTSLFPRANGDVNTWTPLNPPNYSQVNEHSPDDNASYVQANASGNEDLYFLDTLTGSGDIKGTMLMLMMENSSQGITSVEPQYKSGGVTMAPSTFNPSSGAYLAFLDPQRHSLFTGVDWTVAEVNGMQVGALRTS